MEAKHDFILVFDGVPDLTDEVADALYEAGCDDGTFMMRSGRMYGAFHRVAPRMKDAVAGAIRDVRRANIARDSFVFNATWQGRKSPMTTRKWARSIARSRSGIRSISTPI